MRCPFIDPVIWSWGPLTATWYGLLYALAAILWYVITRSEFARKGGPVRPEQMPEILVYGLVGAVLGARLGYVVIGDPGFFLARPWEIFAFWHGGMAFHGALAGMVGAGLLFAHHHRYAATEIGDATFVAIPLGLMLAKIGNFINCESFGTVTSAPWGVVFPAGGEVPRHPVQLYEAFLEGPVLFLILWFLRTRTRHPGDLFGCFLIGYGLFRFLTEFLRETDPRHWLWDGKLTIAQFLSLGMVAVGVVGMVWLRAVKNRRDTQN